MPYRRGQRPDQGRPTAPLTPNRRPTAPQCRRRALPISQTRILHQPARHGRPASGDVGRVLRWATIGTLFDMTDYGYLRTSRQQQDGQPGMDAETQARALEAAGVDPSDVYRNLGLIGYDGLSTSRAGWRALQDRLRPGDTVVVVELARIGHRWTEAVNTIRHLCGEGVRFRSLAEGESTWACYLEADEDSPERFVGELLLQVAAWAAAQELEGNPTSDEGGARPRKGRGQDAGPTVGGSRCAPAACGPAAARRRILRGGRQEPQRWAQHRP